jgi:hypothetical protein
MKTYDVEVEWSGYSRGCSTYRVKAESAEAAKENWWYGERIVHEVVRDDTEVQEIGDVTIVHDVSTKQELKEMRL